MTNPYKELGLAIEVGDCSKLTKYLDDGIPATIEHFLIATQNKDYAILELFVCRGWDINTDVNDSIPSALIYTFEDKKLLEWFLNQGADPNKRCRIRDCTPLSYAVRDGSFESVQFLLDKGDHIYHGQLLHYAAMRTRDNAFEVLQFIYNQDPSYSRLQINKLLDEESPNYYMNERSGLGTPLHYAAMCGSAKMVKFLLDKGSNHDYLDPYHRTATGYAIRNGHLEVQQILNTGRDMDAEIK